MRVALGTTQRESQPYFPYRIGAIDSTFNAVFLPVNSALRIDQGIPI